jgi:hypothetical protein
MTTTKRLAFFWLALLAAAMLAFAACGGGDDDDDDNGGNGEPTAEATEDSDSGDDEGDDDGDGGEDDEETDEPTEDAGDDDGGDDDDGGSDATTAACELLTADEVEDVLGASVGEPEPVEYDETFYGCSWSTEGFDSVDISVLEGEGGESLFDFQNDEAEEVDGLGDRAQWYGDIIGILEVLEDDYYVSVSIFSAEDDEEVLKEQSIGLAEKILDRLD